MTLIEAIRAFCQNDATIKAAVGGARDPNTPYTTWNSEEYNFPYAVMTELSPHGLMRTFGANTQRNADFIEPSTIQFTFWEEGNSRGESRLRTALDYFVNKLDGEVLSLTNTTNFSITLQRKPTVTFFRVDKQNNINAACWQGVAVFDFLQQRKVGTVE